MHIRILAVGKIRERYVAGACDDFALRLRPYFPLEIVEVKASLGSHPAQAMREESERILKAVDAHEDVWLLDRGGEQISSGELSRKLEERANAGARRVTCVIAGTHGAHAALRERASFTWSLSRLTFLREWARMIVLEQLYRAAKIARNEPYHH